VSATCNLTLGRILISNSLISECNGSSISLPYLSPLSIIGDTRLHSIQIANSQTEIRLSHVSIASISPIEIRNSSVSIILESTNSLTSPSNPAIECSGFSNVSLKAQVGGSLSASGGANSTGIGPAPGSICQSIFVQNGSVLAKGGIAMEAVHLTIAETNLTAVGSLVHRWVDFSGTIGLALHSTSPINATEIRFLNASLFATIDGNRFFSVPPSQGGLRKLQVLYGRPTVGGELIAGTGGHFLQFGQLKLPDHREWRFCVNSSHDTECFAFHPARDAGFLVSVPRSGNYTVRATADSESGHLQASGKGVYSISGVTFVKEGVFVQGEPRVTEEEPLHVFVLVGAVVLNIIVVLSSWAAYVVCWRAKQKDGGLWEDALIGSAVETLTE
jgi:hypothetical protein